MALAILKEASGGRSSLGANKTLFGIKKWYQLLQNKHDAFGRNEGIRYFCWVSLTSQQ